MSESKFKFLLFIAWPVLAFVMVGMIVICCVLAIMTLVIVWPLIPFMRVTEKKTGGWNLSWKRT